jgi:hypothetical protein
MRKAEEQRSRRGEGTKNFGFGIADCGRKKREKRSEYFFTHLTILRPQEITYSDLNVGSKSKFLKQL